MESGRALQVVVLSYFRFADPGSSDEPVSTSSENALTPRTPQLFCGGG
jgi:hypothetical protein